MHYLKFIAPLAMAATLLACGEEKAPLAKGPAEVTVTQVIAQETPVSFEYTAQTESSQLVEIRTRVSGFLDKRTYKEGSLVRQGQTLLQIDRKPFEAKLAVAEATLTRVKPLVEQNALSKKDLDESICNERSAAAAVEVARANVLTAELNLGYTKMNRDLAERGIQLHLAEVKGPIQDRLMRTMLWSTLSGSVFLSANAAFEQLKETADQGADDSACGAKRCKT